MASSNGSTVARRRLGRLLAQAREEAGISKDAAANRISVSRATMYRIEGGQAPLDPKKAAPALCRMYGVSPEMTDLIVAYAKESQAQDWWHPYSGAVPEWFDLYLSLEAEACRLRQFHGALIPGLLQTPDYARTLFRTRSGATEEEVALKVELRLERQRLLTRRLPQPPELEVILDESALRRPIADRESMRRQLDYLIECAFGSPRIRFRVLPLEAGPHAASVVGEFAIVEFPPGDPEPKTIYSENLTGSLYLDKPGEVAQYESVWQSLEARALDVEASMDLIQEITKEYAGD